MNEYRAEVSENATPPDWAYAFQALTRSNIQICEKWFDFWTGRAVGDALENIRMMYEMTDRSTGDFKRED